VQVLALLVAVALTYGHTLDVPFYLDDYSSIRENRLVYHWEGFAALREYAPMRVLTYASFALNHRWGGFDPTGYHVVNIVIHLLAGIAVLGFTRGVLRAPRLESSSHSWGRSGLPLLVALVFVLHPLQTGAVTYIVQRLACLAALFYLAALAAYVQARLATARPARVLWSAGCALSALLALFSKENSATLPVAILLVEWAFFEPGRRDRFRLAVIVGGGAMLVWLITAISFGAHPLSLAGMGGVTSQSSEISRQNYLATQMPVLWTYIRLFLWPAGLHLDHAVEVRRFGDGVVMLALAGHLAMISVAVMVGRRRPLIGFGVLFFYLAHGIESGIIPIPELSFEHRNYLPLMGASLAACDLLLTRWPGRFGSGGPLLLAALVPLALGWATWRRNQQWRDPVGFWQDNVRLAPTQARAWGSLGRNLLTAGRPQAAIRPLTEALRLRSERGAADENQSYDVMNLAEAQRQLGRGDVALTLIDTELAQAAKPTVRAALHLARGNLLLERQQLAEAEAAYREALRDDPWNLPVMANLASTLAQRGRLAAADSMFGEVLRLDPGDRMTRENQLQVRAALWAERGDLHDAAGRPAQADSAYRAALDLLEQVARMNPRHPVVEANAARIRARLRNPTR